MKIPNFKKPALNKTWLITGIALTIGLLAALGARSYLSGRVSELEAQSRGKKINIVVAKQDLMKGEKLSSQNVAVRSVPVEHAHSTSVTPDVFDRIDGAALAFPVKNGEAIYWGLLEAKKVPTFSTRIEPGRRAISVQVDEINSISGMLEPGDLVDLIVSVDQKGKKSAVPFLQSVKVLATGQRAVDDPKSGERRMYSTVTLDTDPQQAQSIIMAREAGRMTALLRNPQDKALMTGVSVDLAGLLSNSGVTASSSNNLNGVDRRDVPVLYGGRGGKLTSEGLNMNTPPSSADVPAQTTMPNQANMIKNVMNMINAPAGISK